MGSVRSIRLEEDGLARIKMRRPTECPRCGSKDLWRGLLTYGWVDAEGMMQDTGDGAEIDCNRWCKVCELQWDASNGMVVDDGGLELEKMTQKRAIALRSCLEQRSSLKEVKECKS